ncbi:hypothetical protein NLU13_8945 [Sarocladium strictum]|uniref:Nephrocystin 3-like N-terminal domain-containing protein n=1 Tax=Sarocladium strictum TaxID=5046 RepID=A0AA39L3Z2_SARSR|nr:hypothetical protein NLU13_8945 [Sarocladium strictum]
MEALGAAASVAGLISLAIEIPKLIDTVLTVKAAPEEAKQLLNTANALVATLKKLEAFLKSDEARDMKLADDSGLTISISACQSRILELSKMLYSHFPKSTRTSGSVPRTFWSPVTNFKWPFDKKHCLEVISELHAMQSTFQFCLVLKNCLQMSKCHKEVLAHFESQRNALEQIEAAFPQQATMLTEMASTMGTVGGCIAGAVARLDRIQISLNELEAMKKDLTSQREDKLRGEALDGLSALDPSLRQDEVRSARLPGTCEWAIQSSIFKDWMRSRIIDHLQEVHQPSSGIYTTYLYCDYRQRDEFSLTALYGGLARQLIAQLDTVPKELLEMIHQSRIKLNRSFARLDEIRQVFRIISPYYKRLLVCIDALDECSVAPKLLAYCRDIPGKVSYIFIGRQSIARLVKQSFKRFIIQAMEPQKGDVLALIHERIASEREWQPGLLPNDLAREMKTEVSKLANGMFLLASLHIQLVLSRNTILQRREALKLLPGTLEATFGRTLERIRETPTSKQALMILAYIQVIGPLSMDAIRHALAVEPHHTCFQNENLPTSDSVLDCCLGLFSLDDSRRSDYHGKLTLVHSTLNAFFESHPSILVQVAPDLANTCLTYLYFLLMNGHAS